MSLDKVIVEITLSQQPGAGYMKTTESEVTTTHRYVGSGAEITITGNQEAVEEKLDDLLKTYGRPHDPHQGHVKSLHINDDGSMVAVFKYWGCE
jgi:hypothetical protein